MFIISACLLGKNCKYSGGNNDTEWVHTFVKEHDYISVCPEVIGGLSVPRPPCERVGQRTTEKDGFFVKGRVVNAEGEDVTYAFVKGAMQAWQIAKEEAALRRQKIEGAILKAKSPSCGKGKIYDGTFRHTIIDGDGVFAELLKERGIPVYDENSRQDLL